MRSQKRILHVSFETLSRTHGKGWRIVQSLLSLCPHARLDYAGPPPESRPGDEWPIHTLFPLEGREGWHPGKILNLFRCLPASWYHGWKALARQLDWSRYDALFLDGSRYDFVLRRAQKAGKKTLVRVHHIERDWTLALVKTPSRSLPWIRAVMNLPLMAWREKRTMRLADGLIFTTREDLDRACHLYGESLRSKSIVVPVCLMGPDDLEVHVEVPEKYLLATGSLYLGPNGTGIKWFIRQVWTPLQASGQLDDVALLVAGSKPDPEMKQLCENTPRCTLIDSPEDMAPYFQHASLYVAPVLSGPGMKVKVAEALSYGLRVIGSPHALTGYGEIARFAHAARTPEEWQALILRYIRADGMQQRMECQWTYKDLYTIRRSVADFGRALNRILS